MFLKMFLIHPAHYSTLMIIVVQFLLLYDLPWSSAARWRGVLYYMYLLIQLAHYSTLTIIVVQ